MEHDRVPPSPNAFAAGLTFLNQNPYYGCLAREVLGSNIPHVLVVKNKDEGLDQAVQQFSGTTLCYGGGWVAHHLWNQAEKLFSPKALAATAEKSAFWRNAGKSYALYSVMVGGIYAMSYLRNAFTVWHTKTEGFVDFAERDKSASKQLSPEELKAKLEEYGEGFLKTIGIGLGVALACFGLTQVAQHRLPAPAHWFKRLIQPTVMKDGHIRGFNNFGVTFAGMAAYLGVIAQARDPVERQEWLIKASAFPLAVITMPWLMRKGLEPLLKGKPFKWAGGPGNVAMLAELGVGTLIYGMIPTLTALLTRTQRAKKAGLIPDEPKQTAAPQVPSAPTPFALQPQALSPTPMPATQVQPVLVPALPPYPIGPLTAFKPRLSVPVQPLTGELSQFVLQKQLAATVNP